MMTKLPRIAAVVAIAAGVGVGAYFAGRATATKPSASTTTTAVPPTPATTTSAPRSSTTTTAPEAPVPAGFAPAAVTFVSADDGWVAGLVPAGAGTKLAVARTTDGGGAWSALPAPAVTFRAGGTDHGVGISFANRTDGWITAAASAATGGAASTLWWTHDGGTSWQQVAVPGGGDVAALEAAAGGFQLVTIDPDASTMAIYSASATSDTWARSPTTLRLGAGPVPSADLALHGGSGWLVDIDRVVVAGARLSSSGWQPWTPPCANALGSAAVAASSTTDLVAVCNEGTWGPPPAGTTTASWLFASDDAGTTFDTIGPIPTSVARDDVAGVATPPGEPQVLVVSTGTSLAATADGGKTWRTVYSAPSGTEVQFVGFTTASQGVAVVEGGTTGPSMLLMTHDGGETWSPVTLSNAAAS